MECCNKKNTLFRTVLFAVVILLLFLAGIANSQVAPVYERINSITDNFFRPSYVAVDSSERVYVTETVNNRLSIYSPSGHFIKRLEGLNAPSGVAVDSSGRIFVGNALTAGVEVYDFDFNLLSKLGTGDGEFGKPCGITIDSTDRVYVADCGADQVKIYNPDGSLSLSFGSSGNSTGQFNQPSSIAVDENTGEIMVVDTRYASGMLGAYQAPRVQVFNMSGVYQRIFGARGVDVGRLFRPVGITVDGQSRIYITDAYQNVVQVFSNTFASLGVLYDAGVPVRTPLEITISGGNRLHYASLNTGKVEIYGIDAYVNMEVSPRSLSFQEAEGSAAAGSQDIQLLNSGTAAFTWTAASADSWITLSQTTGALNPTESVNVSVGVDLAGLTVGTYTGSIEVTADSGASEEVDVTLTVAPAPLAGLSVLPSSLAFTSINGSIPTSQALAIENTGGGTINWTASVDRTWIIPDRTAGTAPDTININVDPASLAEGTYAGAVTVDAQGALGSPVTIPVTMNVIWLTGTINVTTNNIAATFTINGPGSYSGGGTNWSVNEAVAGTYVIIYGDVPGYSTPPSESATLQDGGTILFNGQYALETGTISVTTNLADASFTITGPASYSGSGTNWSVTDAPAGTYEIVFNESTGYMTPLSDTRVLTVNGTIAFDGQYVMIDRSIIAGAGAGEFNLGIVGLYDPDGNSQSELFAANYNYYYGANVASGDIDGDGLDEIITAPGPGAGNAAEINIFDRNRNLLPNLSFTAFNFSYGANVASADIDGNGYFEVIAGAGAGRQNPALVKIYVYDPVTQQMTDSGIDLLAYETSYGVNVSAGDVDGDGLPELITSPGPRNNYSGDIRIWDIDTSSGVGQWSASLIGMFSVQSEYGFSVTIASGDVNGDGVDEIIAGDGPHGSARDVVRVFDGAGNLLREWEGGTSINGYGARVASGDLDNDGTAEIVVAPGPGPDNAAFIKVFDMDGTERGSFVPFNMMYGANMAVGFLGLQ